MPATTRTLVHLPEPPVLYLALELSRRSWKLAFSTGLGQKPRLRSIPAGDLDALLREIASARRRFHLDDSRPLLSCYEAGRDGFWIHRFLTSEPGRHNLVVDSASIDVKRRRRRIKTDRIDATKLLAMLVRYHNGEADVWSVVHVPSPVAEDARHLHRELLTLKAQRTRVTNRIKGLLAAHGLSVSSMTRDFPRQLAAMSLWSGDPLPPLLHERLLREWDHRVLLSKRIHLLEQLQLERLLDPTDPAIAMRPLGSSPSSSSPGATSKTGSNSPPSPGSPLLPTRAGMKPATRASPRPATPASAPWPFRSPGGGSAFSPTPPSHSGSTAASPMAAVA